MSAFYIKYEYYLAFSQLLFAMLGMGATLRASDFIAVAKTPKAFFTGISIQLVLVPATLGAALYLFAFPPGFAIGIAILAAIPGGTTSNIYTFFAKGNAALSIAITSVTTVVSLVTVPLILKLLITSHLPSDFQLPVAEIATQTALAILLPLIVGMAILDKLPRIAAQVSRWAIRASLAVIILIIAGASSSGRLDWSEFGGGNAIILMAITFTLAVLGLLTPKLLALSRADIVAIDMEVSVRNINLAVLIVASLFPATNLATKELGSMALFTVLAYGAMFMVPAVLLIVGNRYLSKNSGS